MSIIFVSGGTGTLGQAFIKKVVSQGLSVTCFSRCELKQKQFEYDLKKEFPESNVKFIIGDIRDLEALDAAIEGHDAVFHFAALKHVDVCEKNPNEALKTNVLGTDNIVRACEINSVGYLAFSSTDKAVDPINFYGNTKAIGERLVLNSKIPRTTVLKWGNVIASRGSVIPTFVKTLLDVSPHVHLTTLDMTRFWIKIDEVADFVWYSFLRYETGIQFPEIKAASLLKVVEATASILGVKSYEIKTIGNRGMEKIHERLVSSHDTERKSFDSSDPSYQFTDEELIEFLKPIVLKEAGRV